ncbi:hypothetical protein J1605_023264 [Eschrichtius robustus]|uniref:Basic proline-rich protein-like n=1 Tax=Eschrichtius robustus TaxID=9764 RepID=A0AB34H8I8_ESCRO|nr:hypothetical protein J1605_023264 [Eschrichtius robustus]
MRGRGEDGGISGARRTQASLGLRQSPFQHFAPIGTVWPPLGDSTPEGESGPLGQADTWQGSDFLDRMAARRPRRWPSTGYAAGVRIPGSARARSLVQLPRIRHLLRGLEAAGIPPPRPRVPLRPGLRGGVAHLSSETPHAEEGRGSFNKWRRRTRGRCPFKVAKATALARARRIDVSSRALIGCGAAVSVRARRRPPAGERPRRGPPRAQLRRQPPVWGRRADPRWRRGERPAGDGRTPCVSRPGASRGPPAGLAPRPGSAPPRPPRARSGRPAPAASPLALPHLLKDGGEMSPESAIAPRPFRLLRGPGGPRFPPSGLLPGLSRGRFPFLPGIVAPPPRWSSPGRSLSAGATPNGVTAGGMRERWVFSVLRG